MKRKGIETVAPSLVHATNKRGWELAAKGRYTDQLSDRANALRNGTLSLDRIEMKLIGELLPSIRSAVQLQCADGRDILSIAKLGIPHVMGIDISNEMVALARELARQASIQASFVVSDVIDAPTVIDDTFDLVYTGKGSLMWIFDLQLWAQTISELLTPGGHLVLFDLHPAVTLFRQDTTTLTPTGIDYFDYINASKTWPESYVGKLHAQDDFPKFEHLWTIGDIVNSLIRTGLQITHLGEHSEAYWTAFPKLPEEESRKLPKTLSLVARK